MERHGKYEILPHHKGRSAKGPCGVLLARNMETGEKVAVKKFPRECLSPALAADLEADILQHIALQQHPHIVQFKELCLSEDCLAIVTECVAEGSLFKYMCPTAHLEEPLAK